MTLADNDNTSDLPPSMDRHRIVLLSGMSGAGISTALKTFEDLGYEAVDNLRLSLIPALLEEHLESEAPALAVAIDTRVAAFSASDFLEMIDMLRDRDDLEVRFLFLDCADDKLQRRFTETRRRHPLAIDRPVTDGIDKERIILAPLHDAADHVIDTSLLTLHDLRRLIVGGYKLEAVPVLSLFVTSFSYRQGLPREADLVFDARFLANPYWDPKLRTLSGLDQPVADYVRADPDYQAFFERMTDLLLPLLPRFLQEGKSYLTIAVGCTGGRHRSVFVAEELANFLALHDYVVGVGHRDLERSASRQAAPPPSESN